MATDEIKTIPQLPVEIFDAVKQLAYEIEQVCAIHAKYFGHPERGAFTAASVEMQRDQAEANLIKYLRKYR